METETAEIKSEPEANMGPEPSSSTTTRVNNLEPLNTPQQFADQVSSLSLDVATEEWKSRKVKLFKASYEKWTRKRRKGEEDNLRDLQDLVEGRHTLQKLIKKEQKLIKKQHQLKSEHAKLLKEAEVCEKCNFCGGCKSKKYV